MSLLLCRKEADNPYYCETLDLRLWSLPELCYVIYHHPLLALRDFDGEALCIFLRDELALGFLAAKLSQLMRKAEAAGEEAPEELLLCVLSESGLYLPAETEACRKRFEAYRNCPEEQKLHAEGVSLFRLKRYRLAEDCFQKELAFVRENLRKTPETDRAAKETLAKKASDLYHNLAVIRVRFFDREGATGLLQRAEELFKTPHTARLRLLLAEEGETAPGTEALSDGEKKKLSEERAQARLTALSGERMRELETARELDPVKREAACASLLGAWKKEYRRMN